MTKRSNAEKRHVPEPLTAQSLQRSVLASQVSDMVFSMLDVAGIAGKVEDEFAVKTALFRYVLNATSTPRDPIDE